MATIRLKDGDEQGADGLCGSEVRMRHVHPEVLVSEPNGRSRLTTLAPT